MLQQVERGRAQQQVLGSPLATAPCLINQPAQHGEKAGRTVNLVENDQLVQVIGKIQLWLRKLGAVVLGLKVKVNAGDGSGCLQRECGFAGLARPQQGNGW